MNRFEHIWRRGIAYLIDIIIVVVAMYIMILLNIFGGIVILDILFIILLLALPLLYFIILETAYGQTLGKKILKIKVVKGDGNKANWFSCIIRNIFRFIDVLPFIYLLGIILILVTNNKQRLGDIIAGTIIIKI